MVIISNNWSKKGVIMALIKCPECGKEISDKSSACIHCGYPMDTNNEADEVNRMPDISFQLDAIMAQTEDFMNNLKFYNEDFNMIFVKIKSNVDSIQREILNCDSEAKRIAHDKIALTILNVTMKAEFYCSWVTIKNCFELVDFTRLSENTMKKISAQIFERLSIINVYSDGSSGNSHHIHYWYPIQQLLLYGSEEVKKPIEQNLAQGDRLSIIQFLVSEHSGEDTQAEVIAKIAQGIHPNINTPKCPTCGSSQVSKIKTLERTASVFGLGLFSKKINKTFKCSNCGYTW